MTTFSVAASDLGPKEVEPIDICGAVKAENARLRAALAVSAAFVHAFGYYRATVCGDDAEAWDAVISAHDALSAAADDGSGGDDD